MSTSGMREAMPLPFEENGEEQWGEGEGSKLTTSLEISSSLFQPIVNCIQQKIRETRSAYVIRKKETEDEERGETIQERRKGKV